jgi:hypothetical protein
MVRVGLVSIFVLSLLAVGCTSYYIVRVPGTGQSYFTTDIDHKRGGAVTLQDEKTGAEVTIQNSEIRRVHKDEYKAAMAAPPPAPAQPQVIIQNVQPLPQPPKTEPTPATTAEQPAK